MATICAISCKKPNIYGSQIGKFSQIPPSTFHPTKLTLFLKIVPISNFGSNLLIIKMNFLDVKFLEILNSSKINKMWKIYKISILILAD